MKFRAACVQLSSKKVDVPTNIRRIAEVALGASQEGADLCVFPETVTSGYFLQGGVGDVAMSANELAEKIRQAFPASPDKDLDLVVGFYENADGVYYNSSAHIHFASNRATVLHVHRKFFLATYGVFDEERFVARGTEICAYETRFGKFSMLICEDVWHSITPTVAVLKGAECVVALVASPVRGFSGETFGNLDRYERMLRAIAEEHGVWVLSSMLVGFEGGKGFSGGSIILNPFGETRGKGPELEEYILMGDVDMNEIKIARSQFPGISDLRSVLEDVLRELSEVTEEKCEER